MVAGVADSYTGASGETIYGGRLPVTVSVSFTQGTASSYDLEPDFPDVGTHAVAVQITNGTLPTGVTLDPLGKTLDYDGVGEITDVNVTLTSTQDAPSISWTGETGTLPVSAAVVFPKGQVTGSIGTSVSTLHVTPTRTWNDGSVKHAHVSGLVTNDTRVTFNQNPDTISTPMRHADIVGLAPTATVTASTSGAVSLSSLLASPPFRTLISTPDMVECHYRSDVGASNMMVWFHVRAWSNGTCWVRVLLENAPMIRSGSPNYTENFTIVIDGTTVQSLISYELWVNTGVIGERWVGATQYDIAPVHDMDQVASTELVPTLGFATQDVSEATLDSYGTYTYTVGDRGLWRQDWGDGADHPMIGPFPSWESCHLVSSDPRTFSCMQAQIKTIFQYPICWRTASNEIVSPQDNPTGNYASLTEAGGADRFTCGVGVWEYNHVPSIGYISYLLTGDQLSFDAMCGELAIAYQSRSTASTNCLSYGPGIERMFIGSARGIAWNVRQLACVSALLPDGDRNKTQFGTWLYNHALFYRSYSVDDPAAVNSELGYPGAIGTYKDTLPQSAATWMHNFWVWSFGFVSDLDAMSDSELAMWTPLRDWMYRGVVGLLGTASDYCFNYATTFYLGVYPATIVVQDNIVTNNCFQRANLLYQTWAEVFTATHGAASCANTLDEVQADAATNRTWYWANLLPAIAMARKHEATGATEAWARVTGADNYAQLRDSDWQENPKYGVTPPADVVTEAVGTNIVVEVGSQWTALPEGWTQLYSGSTAAVSAGTEPPAGIVAYSGLGVDTSTGTLYLFGGGHRDYYGNEVWAFDLENPAWTRLYTRDIEADPPIDDVWAMVDASTLPGGYTTTNRPYSRHTYNSIHWLESTQRLIAGGASSYSGSTSDYLWDVSTPPGPHINQPKDTWLFNPTTITWAFQGSTLLNAAYLNAAYSAYDYNTEKIYGLGKSNSGTWEIWEYDPALNTWTDHNVGASVAYFNVNMGYDTTRSRVLMYGGQATPPSDELWAYDVSTKVWTDISPSTGTRPPAGGFYGITYDSVNDKVLVTNNGTMWVYDSTTQTWAQGDNGPVNLTQATGRLYYDRNRQVTFIAYANGSKIDVYAYKTETTL